MVTRDGELGPNVTHWKLVDVPDLGYYTTDKPFPRGELLIKTKTMIDGYYKHQDVSSLLSLDHANPTIAEVPSPFNHSSVSLTLGKRGAVFLSMLSAHYNMSTQSPPGRSTQSMTWRQKPVLVRQPLLSCGQICWD